MKKRSIQIISIFLIGITMNSCGIFLQKTGMKNYSLKDKIDRKEFNDYQYDFTYLSHLLDKGFPEIDSIFPKRERKEKEDVIINALSKNNLENKDFALQARKYLSNFHNQHTNIYLKSEFKTVYPFTIHISYNNWYLLNIDNKQDSLHIGKKIKKINGVDINEIEKKLYDFTFAENKINQQYEIRNTQFYNKPLYLKEINIIQELTDKIKITFTDNSSISLEPVNTDKKLDLYKINIPSNEITKKQNKTYTYKIYPNQDFGYLQFNKSHDKIDILDGIESYVKPWLQPIARGYVKRQFKKEKPSKQIAPYYNSEYPIFKDFVWELIDSLNSNNIKNLVIDLRNNPGGNLTLGIQLMYFLTNKTDLKGFTEYAYTSDIYKSYFPDEYKELEEQYPNGIPKDKLVLKKESNNLFDKILNSKSKYYVPKNRPIFKGKVYVISNYRTGSAAAMLTTLFQDNKISTIIGTSVGNNPTGATTYTPMKLPKTKASISIATTYQERPNKEKGKVQIPDYWVEYSISDLITGKDPYLEKIKELMSNASR
jgi:Peptidase family S41